MTQKLTVLAIELSLLDSSLNAQPKGQAVADTAECAATIGKLTGLVNELIDSAQEITAQLRPKVLDEFGLVAALEWLTQRFQNKTGIKCELSANGAEGHLDPSVAVELYRLSQEVLANVAEDRQTSRVAIHLESHAGYLCMDIRDNRPESVSRKMSDRALLALLAMRERTEHLGGRFDMKNQPDAGTTISVRIPLRERL